MLKVECEACKAPYQVDERRVPVTGLKMRCPKCGHSFIVQNPNGQAPAAPRVAPPQVPSKAPAAAAPGPTQGAPTGQVNWQEYNKIVDAQGPAPAARPASSFGEIDLADPSVETDLPAAKPQAPKPPRPLPPGSLNPPAAARSQAPAQPSAAAAGPPKKQTMMGIQPAAMPPRAPAGDPGKAPGPIPVDDPFAGLDLPAAKAPAAKNRTMLGTNAPGASPPSHMVAEDMDLPALAGEVGLPAALGAAKKPAKPPVPAAKAASAPAPPAQSRTNAPSLQDFEIDLPSMQDLPAPKAPGGGAKKGPITFDLDPAGPGADLPSAKPAAAGRPPANPPASASTKVGFGDIDAGLPMAKPRGGFGDIDAGLPVPAKRQPAANPKAAGGVAFGEIDLPMLGGNLPAVAQNNLPAVANVGLPAVSGVGLPAVANVGLPAVSGAGLPAVAGAGLPAVSRAGLPSVAGAGLPAVGGVGLPSATDARSHLPSASGAGHSLLPSVGGNLPSAIDDQRHMPMAAGEADFGDLDLPRHQGADLPKARRPTGVGYGEVDLGSPEGSADEAEIDALSRAAGTLAPEDVAALGDDAPVARRPDRAPARSNRGARVVVGIIALLIVAGALLEFSTYGAFGYRTILDVFHRGEYQRVLDAQSRAARAKLGDDLFDDARAAVEDLAAAHQQNPRARDLTAYTAIAEYETQLRFGRDAARATRAKGWVDEVRLANPDAHYLPIAAAGQKAVDGDLTGARADLEAASAKDPGDAIQQDVALLRGEVELAGNQAAAALAAFTKAAHLAPSARAQYGLARAYAQGGDLDKARAAVNAALTASPSDAGALAMRAELVWDKERDEAGAMKDLVLVTEGSAKAHASAIDQARAYALQGWILLARGRVADARAAFDASLKLDASSVGALVGQGEVLYKEGRFSEALAHFDTAVQKEPLNARAVVDDAKTKIALERLADAKAQLLAARQSLPKAMLIAFWLGKSEEALGNRKPAEQDFVAAIGLIDPKADDAILPYMALAELQIGEDRADEAKAKLAEAQKALPDSAGMQRALGEVAAVQGNYDEAVRHYQAAVAKDPQDLSSRFLLGVTYRKMQKLDDAAAAFQAVGDADKDYPGLTLERGLLAEQSGHVDQALEQFRAAAAKAPDDIDLQLHVGEALVLIGKVDEALKTLNKVIVKRSSSAEANHFLGRALFMQGVDTQAAKRYLEHAVEIDPNQAEYHLYVAWIANESNDLGTADAEIRKALAINKLLPEAYWQRGAVERVRTAVDDAIKDLKTALQLKPTLYQADAELALCYADKNEQNLAMAEWQRALNGDGDRPMWNYQYGKLLLEKGNYAAAAPHLLTAVGWTEKTADGDRTAPVPFWAIPAEFSTAVALQKTGKRKDAIEHYNRFLDHAAPNSPDKRDALAALRALGAPYDNR